MTLRTRDRLGKGFDSLTPFLDRLLCLVHISPVTSFSGGPDSKSEGQHTSLVEEAKVGCGLGTDVSGRLPFKTT